MWVFRSPELRAKYWRIITRNTRFLVFSLRKTESIFMHLGRSCPLFWNSQMQSHGPILNGNTRRSTGLGQPPLAWSTMSQSLFFSFLFSLWVSSLLIDRLTHLYIYWVGSWGISMPRTEFLLFLKKDVKTFKITWDRGGKFD